MERSVSNVIPKEITVISGMLGKINTLLKEGIAEKGTRIGELFHARDSFRIRVREVMLEDILSKIEEADLGNGRKMSRWHREATHLIRYTNPGVTVNELIAQRRQLQTSI